jgi:hypothetical protein
MKNKNNNPSSTEQLEDNELKNQLVTIFQYLEENVATASMVSNDTGIPQKNICRNKRDLEKAGRLWEIEKNLCRRTGYKAWHITTNPDKASNNNQLNLF